MSFFNATIEFQAWYFAFFISVASCNYSCTLDESICLKPVSLVCVVYLLTTLRVKPRENGLLSNDVKLKGFV